MSYVFAMPEMMIAAATDLAAIGSTVREAHTTATPALAVIPAAVDEVSVGITQLFSQHAQGFQALATEAVASHEQFVLNLKTSAPAYPNIEDITALFMPGYDRWVYQVQLQLSQIPYLAYLREFLRNALSVSIAFVCGFFGIAIARTAVTVLTGLIPKNVSLLSGI